VSEVLLQQAASELNIPVAIYRPGSVSGDSQTGASNQEAFVNRLILGCMQLKAFPAVPEHTGFDWAPVDYVADAISYITINSGQTSGYRVFHTDNPLALASLTLDRLGQAMKLELPGVKMLSYNEWVVALRAAPTNALNPLVHYFDQAFPKSTRYVCDNTLRALESSGISCSVLTEEVLRKYVKFYA